jgi:hypothetical protein
MFSMLIHFFPAPPQHFLSIQQLTAGFQVTPS